MSRMLFIVTSSLLFDEYFELSSVSSQRKNGRDGANRARLINAVQK